MHQPGSAFHSAPRGLGTGWKALQEARASPRSLVPRAGTPARPPCAGPPVPVCLGTQSPKILDAAEWPGRPTRLTYMPASSTQSVKFWTIPRPVGPNNECDKTEALGFGYLAPGTTQLSEQVHSRVSWFQSTEQPGAPAGRPERTSGCRRGQPGTWASSGTGSCCASPGGPRWVRQGRLSRHQGGPGPCGESGTLLCPAAGPASAARVDRAPEGPQRVTQAGLRRAFKEEPARARPGLALWVCLRGRRRGARLCEAAAAPPSGPWRTRG